jgi:nitrogen fixation protein FixH
MSPTVLPTSPRHPKGVTGRHVFLAVLLFFATVFAVNGVMLYKALSTHSGLVAQEPYRKGLRYNERIAADERQRELGWRETMGLAASGAIDVMLVDAAGKPVTGLALTSVVGRPSEGRHDRRVQLTEREPGRYIGEAGPLDAGTWLLAVEARPVLAPTADAALREPIYRAKRRLWLKP